MPDPHIDIIARELKLIHEQVAATVELLDDDATVPVIARYRKERTGGLDEIAIMSIRDRLARLRELDKRRQSILKSLTDRDLLTDELKARLMAAASAAELEDIYLPFRPKRRTRAAAARERGLEPLAEQLFVQDDVDPDELALAYIDPEREVTSTDEALAGARDIIAEWISEDADVRARLRLLFADEGVIRSTVKTDKASEGAKFSDYFDWQEPAMKAASHRILAMRRGEAAGILNVHIAPSEEAALAILEETFVIGDNAASEQVRVAAHDSYRRLLRSAIQTEIRNDLTERAERDAIQIFSDNLRELLMAPPMGRKRVLAIDPGFRTGCKVVCLDRQGKLLHHTTIQPHASDGERRDAGVTLKALCEKFRINVIAIGNGTAGRETESFVRGLKLPKHIAVETVNEAGASIYSVSDVARQEFPDLDATVRGAVSIGRRLMDPLAELVKIDPKSIGVGQYQHDVDQAALKRSLDDIVMSCVNAVGIDLNTASKELLTYVSGVGPVLAQSIVARREDHGPFKSRAELSKVSRLGPKAFEQAAGFLRVYGGKQPLDETGVHPESYPVVEKMARDIGCTVEQLMRDPSHREKINLNDHVSGKVGLPTLLDAMEELGKPGRDPRPEYESFAFESSVNTPADLKVGMRLPGVVTNVTSFGAFVDVGVHQDGLVHISELSEGYVKDPADVVRVHQRVMVTVLEVDLDRNRVSLSMRKKSEG